MLLGVVLAFAAVVVVLAVRNRQAPVLPPDEVHATTAVPVGCEECHGPGAPLARSTNHPLGNDCLRCHGRP